MSIQIIVISLGLRKHLDANVSALSNREDLTHLDVLIPTSFSPHQQSWEFMVKSHIFIAVYSLFVGI
jgi:hypothetical protein